MKNMKNMKNSSKELYKAIGEINDDTIMQAKSAGASPAENRHSNRKPISMQFAGVAAAIMLLVAGTIAMFYFLAPDDLTPVTNGTTAPNVTQSAPEVTQSAPEVTQNNSIITGNEPFTPLTAEREREILEAYAKYLNGVRAATGHFRAETNYLTADELYIQYYFGNYNGYDIVTVWVRDWAFTTDMKPVVIDGYMVAHLSSGSFEVMVYTENENTPFVCIEEAYEQGLLRLDDLRAMTFMRLRRGYAVHLYWEMNAQYNPDIFDEIINDVYVRKYYGNYDGLEFVTMWHKDRDTDDAIKEFTVARYNFTLSSTCLDIKLAGHFLDLATAYEQGWIHINIIHQLHAEHFVEPLSPLVMPTEVGTFSYSRDWDMYGEAWSAGGFFGPSFLEYKNTQVNPVTDMDTAIDLAKNEVSSRFAYNRIAVCFDEDSEMWRVLFYTELQFGGCQTVYMTGNGITTLIVFGE